MRCSVSPFSRAKTVCMLRQFAQPLICEARISTRCTSFGSRLEAIASDARCHSFICEGAAAKGLIFTVMIGSCCWFRHHDEAAPACVTPTPEFLSTGGAAVEHSDPQR